MLIKYFLCCAVGKPLAAVGNLVNLWSLWLKKSCYNDCAEACTSADASAALGQRSCIPNEVNSYDLLPVAQFEFKIILK
jgi:hypothetical protein